ncbi:2-dehydropantoate 2-reductase [Malikia sp.]|uniref:2-dehydropantoate 2-reductase n=1 Tax=Malikia sp. TaxID=2070706 RepID=UPI00262CE120|nr:2-dehydropantoate 2-reductase [Malikia sp.]MDD2729068.1 2-dehydropantoate 2-reductase [Malikia sp.]
MKIAIMGAGAVGSYYGGLLALAGHEVTLIGRAAHVAAIEHAGLRLQTQSFDEPVAASASVDPAALADADWVLVCVKAGDTEAAAAAISPHLRDGALVLSLQNGLDNADRLQALLPRQRVRPVLVYAAVELAGPGHVRHHGRGELVIGAGPDSEALVTAFAGAGVPVQVLPDVRAALWSKLMVNCAYNALSAISRLPYGRMIRGPGIEASMREAVAECLAVARADGIHLPADSWERVRALADAMPTQRSSTAQDLARGRRSEIDQLNGYVVRRGEALGVPTPVNRALHGLVKLLEDPPPAE